VIETVVISEPSLLGPNAGAMLIQEHIVQEVIVPHIEEEAKEEPLKAEVSRLVTPKL